MGQQKQIHVLLLGNGINRSFGGMSWGKIIDEIKNRSDVDSVSLKAHNVPMPLQAILATNNNIKDAVESHKTIFCGAVESNEQKTILQHILSIGLDDILTTNYSYELENVAFNAKCLSDYKLKQISKSTCGKVEGKYLIHSYNEVEFKNSKNRIWHIHGESRKPSSIILSHYLYAHLLFNMKKEIVFKRDSYSFCQSNGKELTIKSWIDSFILGNVYILGFEFDFSEIDLWWLLNRKYNEKANVGKVYFYALKNDSDYEKVELLKLFGVEPINLNMEKPVNDD